LPDYPSPVVRWALLAAVPLVAAAAVSLGFVLRGSKAQPASAVSRAITWKPGEQPAPPIALRAADGSRFTLGSLRGRNVIVTFVDPHCTTFCPRESLVIDDAVRSLPARERPAIVAVSVDPRVRSRAVLAREARRFRWLPQWRWATGTEQELRRVWRRYHIEVVPAKSDINHTEAAYVIDAAGDERALLLWPFRARDVSAALAALAP
jgi:cytochrome oxidase Cu insertion factor (SCO1/SenC/PrrC family)